MRSLDPRPGWSARATGMVGVVLLALAPALALVGCRESSAQPAAELETGPYMPEFDVAAGAAKYKLIAWLAATTVGGGLLVGGWLVWGSDDKSNTATASPAVEGVNVDDTVHATENDVSDVPNESQVLLTRVMACQTWSTYFQYVLSYSQPFRKL